MTGSECQGCGAAATTLQCPLCQAEALADRGFFCSQECFATNWLAHRTACHPSGVVRQKKAAQQLPPLPNAKEKKNGKAAKRERAEESPAPDVEAAVPALPVLFPWVPVPSAANARRCIVPELPLGCPRAVVAAAADSTSAADAMWPSLVAAAHYAADSLRNDPTLHILVAAGDAYSAHAFAWAARCVGLTGAVRMAVSALHLPENPADYFTEHRRLVVATSHVLRYVGGTEAVSSGAASLWLQASSSLLLTLPDVTDAADLQGVNTRAIFFTGRRSADGPASLLGADAWAAEEVLSHTVASRLLQDTKTEDGTVMQWLPMPMIAVVGEVHPEHASTEPGYTTPAEAIAVGRPSRGAFLTPLMDNETSTCAANGDVAGMLQHLVRVYSAHPGVFEEILFNVLCCDWGALSVAHAHHRLAYIMRCLLDHGGRFTAKKGATLTDSTLRAMVHVVRLLPPLTVTARFSEDVATSGTVKTKAKRETSTTASVATVPPPTAAERTRLFNYYSTVPNLQLQATIIFLFDVSSSAALDTLALAWAVDKYVAGKTALMSVNGSRSEFVHRLRTRYGTKLGPGYADYLVTLMHVLYDAVAMYSLSLEAVQHRLLWELTLGHDLGPLDAFLRNCGLLPEAEAAPTNKVGLSSRQASHVKAPPRDELLRREAVKAESPSAYTALPWLPFPLCGKRQREVEQLHKIALEEVLMAMPRVPRPMYIGDVGNLIGKWFRFNARFDGVLGVSLSDFMSKHPDAFTVSGKLVTRRKAGKSDQVRVRFDQDDNLEDSDDEDKGRKRRDRALLTGKQRRDAKLKELPSRARKRIAVKEFNRSRHNRNYKQVDPLARVPGYVKHGPRKIKGRGKKANKRLTKRN